MNVDKLWSESMCEYRDMVSELTLDDIKFFNKINKFALITIDIKKVYNPDWLHVRIQKRKNDPIWKHLSSDKSSAKYFQTTGRDGAEGMHGIFFVDTNFLIKNRGNKTGGLGKEDSLRAAFVKGNKVPTPQYWLQDGNLGEGNHRTLVMKEMGYKSVPVRIYWGSE